METSFFTEVLKGLAAAGPVAMVLGFVCYSLWKQNVSLLAKLERQHDKTLKLAVRVQRAVEVLAGIEHESTEIEEVLEAEDKKEKEREDHDRDERRRNEG